MRRMAPARGRDGCVVVHGASFACKDGARPRRLQAGCSGRGRCAPRRPAALPRPPCDRRKAAVHRRPAAAAARAPLSLHASFRFGRQRPGLYRSSHVHPEVQFGSARVHRHCPLHDRQSRTWWMSSKRMRRRVAATGARSSAMSSARWRRRNRSPPPATSSRARACRCRSTCAIRPSMRRWSRCSTCTCSSLELGDTAGYCADALDVAEIRMTIQAALDLTEPPTLRQRARDGARSAAGASSGAAVRPLPLCRLFDLQQQPHPDQRVAGLRRVPVAKRRPHVERPAVP